MAVDFDPGPPHEWATLFAAAPLDFYRQQAGRFRTEFGPVYYRGRLDGSARILIVGQDPSTDEILAQRALVGDAGQRLQGYLGKLGLTRSYLMLNTFLYGIYGQYTSAMAALSAQDPLRSYRNQLFDHALATNALAAVLAFGKGAQAAVNHWPAAGGLRVFSLLHPTARNGVAANWNQQMASISAAAPPDPGAAPDLTPYGAEFTPADSVPIPRADLPFGLPPWHGAGSATHSQRSGPTVIRWTAPTGD